MLQMPWAGHHESVSGLLLVLAMDARTVPGLFASCPLKSEEEEKGESGRERLEAFTAFSVL